MKHLLRLFVAITLLSFNPVYAGIIDSLFNTGMDSVGNVLLDGTLNDPHYTLTTVPAGSTTTTRIITSASGFPIGPYIGDNALSRWIGPNNTGDLYGPAGDYNYRTTFDLTGLDFSTASIDGRWSTDNQGLDILINGNSLGLTNVMQFSNWTNFTINSGFISGINTLDYVVNNLGNSANPTALRVEMVGTASTTTVPEPSVLALMGMGLVSLGFIRKKT